MDTTTSIFLNISIVVQIIMFVALIFLVMSLTKIIKGLFIKVEELQVDFFEYKKRLDPILADTLELLKKINRISEKVEGNVDSMKGTIDKVKKTTEDIVEFVAKVKSKVEPPVMETVTMYSAFIKGIKVFVDRMKSGKSELISQKEDDNLLFDDVLGPVTDSISAEKDEINFDTEFSDINKELNEVRKKLEEMKKV